MPTSPTPLLSLRKVTKRYPGIIANDQIVLDVMPASIHAILGENGAGKSTLMKLVYGVTSADEGSIYWQGQQVEMKNTAQARKLGIGMVFQHFSLFETMTVVENISMTVPGSRKQLVEKIITLGEKYNLSVNPQAEVHSLSVGERQRVEILRCLMQDLKLLILDEPTSVLPPQHVQSLFVALRKLQASGVAILYISHKLEEIRDLCDTATILQAGKVTGSVNPREKTSKELSVLMIGRNIPHITSNPVSKLSTQPRLQLNKLSLENDDPFGISLSDIDLKVHGGEIVGIAGVSGNGQQELSRIISGELIKQGLPDNAIMMMDRPVTTLGVTGRRKLGFSFVPEERLGRGAVPPMSLADNALLTAYEKGMLSKGFINRKKTTAFTQECIDQYDVRCRDIHSSASSLSGGNLQKFIVGREIMLSAELLFVSQPTWGVDIGAATAIRQRLLDLRDQGIAILVISEELEELFEISDRLHIISDGYLSPSFETAHITPEEVGEYMIGSKDIHQKQSGEAINAN